MSLPPKRFPVELLDMVLAQQSPHDLASASLVCQQWQCVAFPYLYCAMYLSEYAHLEVLAERLSETNVPESLSVPAHLKCLAFGGSNINYIDSKDIDSIISQLVNLTCFSWELPFTPDRFDWFGACPNLEAVHLVPWYMWENDDWIERLPQLLTFTNLTHFSLKFEPLPYENQDKAFEPLRLLIQSSPNLESLILSFQVRDSAWATYSPTSVLESLGDQFVLPRLHTFHMLGAADPDWYEFVSDPSNPFRAFLARHLSIRDLGIGCPVYFNPRAESVRMDPDELSRLLPSVKHLAFPSFMWESVVKSELASHLESLTISNLAFLFHGDPLRTIAETMGENSLPKVRKIAILPQMGVVLLTIEALEAFLSAAKGLEELEFEFRIERAAGHERRKTRYRVIGGEWDLPSDIGEEEWDLTPGTSEGERDLTPGTSEGEGERE